MRPASRQGFVYCTVCSLRRRQFILTLKGFFNRKSAEVYIGDTNKFFSFCFFSITYRFSERLEAGGGTTVKSAGLPQSGNPHSEDAYRPYYHHLLTDRGSKLLLK
jgi:hypothetical protein